VDQCVGRRGLERLDHDRFDHVIADRAGRARPRCVNQSVETILGEPVPPLADRRRMTAQIIRDLAMRTFPPPRRPTRCGTATPAPATTNDVAPNAPTSLAHHW
jgi:hypothetical protein